MLMDSEPLAMKMKNVKRKTRTAENVYFEFALKKTGSKVLSIREG